ncbi:MULTISPECIES: O-antigen ligase family protein [Rhizobium]|uniref:O-antigen ligase family protein n=1 Tax=Rhizobium TaxID=379 RepID=UPI00234EC8C2|nr:MULTISPECIES: O-antigen ligase family protein [unclassified Rhizobium]MDC7745125.1 O-antigen ligase family protein [Rhizobium sp. BC56]MDC9811304.1 O-antigen ligase family protein [Rhizobium sp. MC62]
MLKPIVATLFAINMMLAVVLVRLSVGGLPVRLLFVAVLLAVVGAYAPGLIVRAVTDQRNQIFLIAFLTCCALISSALVGDGFTYSIAQVFQIHIQAIVGLIVGYCVITIVGYQSTVLIFLLPIAISSIFAALQFAGFSPAWSAYDALSALQPRDLADFEGFDAHYRALGLSYSPVHLGTQLCLAFAVIFAYRVSQVGRSAIMSGLDRRLIATVAITGFVAICSGNRSPMLGLAVFFCLYLASAKPMLGLLAGLFMAAAVLLGDSIVEAMNSSGLRTFNTENSSGEGRLVLSVYGSMLFFYRPFGYGLSFDSVAHYSEYWDWLKNYPNSQAITIHALHNYYLMFINKHGVLALFVVPYLLRAFSKNLVGVLAFVPYLVHIFYHNDGPLQADFMFWYIIPLVAQNPAFYPQQDREMTRTVAAREPVRVMTVR